MLSGTRVPPKPKEGGAATPALSSEVGPGCRTSGLPGRRTARRTGHHSLVRTRPTTRSRGTGPNERESTELARSSPSTKTEPAGTVTGP